MENSFVYSPDDVLSRFNVTQANGLSDSQVKAALETYGRNGMFKLAKCFKFDS
jgi:Cation transporter/ATPase, N-terminus